MQDKDMRGFLPRYFPFTTFRAFTEMSFGIAAHDGIGPEMAPCNVDAMPLIDVSIHVVFFLNTRFG